MGVFRYGESEYNFISFFPYAPGPLQAVCWQQVQEHMLAQRFLAVRSWNVRCWGGFQVWRFRISTLFGSIVRSHASTGRFLIWPNLATTQNRYYLPLSIYGKLRICEYITPMPTASQSGMYWGYYSHFPFPSPHPICAPQIRHSLLGYFTLTTLIQIP